MSADDLREREGARGSEREPSEHVHTPAADPLHAFLDAAIELRGALLDAAPRTLQLSAGQLEVRHGVIGEVLQEGQLARRRIWLDDRDGQRRRRARRRRRRRLGRRGWARRPLAKAAAEDV